MICVSDNIISRDVILDFAHVSTVDTTAIQVQIGNYITPPPPFTLVMDWYNMSVWP